VGFFDEVLALCQCWSLCCCGLAGSGSADHAKDPADLMVSRRLPWPLRTTRALVDDPAAEFQTENGKSLFRRKLTGDGIWILELEGR
jgi:hypothetical protein